MVAKARKPELRGYGRVSSKSGDIKAQQRLLRQAGLVPDKISDIAVSGTVPVDQRKIWQDFAKQGVSKVYVKNHKRFARSVVTQELGLKFTDKHKMEVVALDFPTLLTNRTNRGNWCNKSLLPWLSLRRMSLLKLWQLLGTSRKRPTRQRSPTPHSDTVLKGQV